MKRFRFWRFVQRPEYFLRPSQIWRRLRRSSFSASEFRLAWGLPAEVDLRSSVGIEIRNMGIHDRIVPETICRLLDPGEQGFDLGSHVGQNASMMALAAGPAGRVTAFEPALEAAEVLSRNIGRWSAYRLAPIELVRKGVSSGSGTRLLRETDDRGSRTLEATPAGGQRFLEGEPGAEIELTTLDQYLPEDETAGLIKIDVEGHELAVLEGARRILAERRVRDIIFEDFARQPSPVTQRLEAAGYTVYYLRAGWSKPMLVPVAESDERLWRNRCAPNFLATTDPERAKTRFHARGWRSLRVRAVKLAKEGG
jgi:FkbM family methyltransferase